MRQSDIPARQTRRVAFRGPIFDVTREAVRLASGHRAVYDVVRHRGSVVLIPQPTARTIVLIRQFRWAIGQWIWELPAGSLEPGERPDRAARRECAEEVGLRPSRVERLGAFYPTPGFCDERMIFYRCTGLERPARPVTGDADEQIEPRTFTLTEVHRMITCGEIVDMKTICGLALLD
jgi:ADP-ribose pyrophosphatase